jgi:hypothetical protein
MRFRLRALSFPVRLGFAFALVLLLIPSSQGATAYLPNSDLARELESLAKSHPDFIHVEQLTTSPASNRVWCVELGSGDNEKRLLQPAILAVAGIEGNDLAGSASLLAWGQYLAASCGTNDNVRKLLDSTTVYILPRINPDAAENFFKKPRLEISTDLTPVDDDHDGLLDEDGPDDLNQDGLITSMRVKDPEGEYILDPVEPRLLLKADRTKGEVGAWKLLSEGVDDDHDEEWNEDGTGGVNYNRNFPYGFKFFAPWSGLHPMSEGVTRSLADFVIKHPNIGIVFTFGSPDNLIQTPKAEAPKRPPVTIHEDDAGIFRELGKNWRETLGLKKELTGNSEPGSFSDWIYFHRGRLSLAARPWSPAIQLALAEKPPEKKEGEKPAEAEKATKPAKEGAGEKKGEDDHRNEEDRAFLKWLDQNAPELFVPWRSFDHPDFKGETVEIGGFAPYAKSNPPDKLLDGFTQKHIQYLTRLAGKLPRIGVRKAEAKHLGNSVYEIVIQVENTGYLPTALAQGELNREVHPTRIEWLDVDDQHLLSGQKRTMLGTIPGSGGMKETRWILNGKGQSRIHFRVISMLGGTIEKELELKEAN